MIDKFKKQAIRLIQYFSKKNIQKRATKSFIAKMEPIISQVSHEANEIAAKDRGVFIDCGSNQGQGYDFFSKWFPAEKFDHLLIEPNPNCISILETRYSKQLSEQHFKIIPKAASIKNGFTKFFGLSEGTKNPVSAGGSILDVHNSAYYSVIEDKAIEIETFDFVEFIQQCRQKYSVIIIKMDIEGAEYDILEELTRKNLANNISTLFLEFHSTYMKHVTRVQYQKKEKYLLQELKKQGCHVHIWI